MSFKTLEDRFNEVSRDIYGRLTNPTINYIRPDRSSEDILNDTRRVPTVSTQRDSRVISTFLSSQKGVLFIDAQKEIQTGNTFIQTRKLDTNFVLKNVQPFTHATRHNSSGVIRGIFLGGTSGLLQNDTIDTLSGRFLINKGVSGILNSVLNNPRNIVNSVRGGLRLLRTAEGRRTLLRSPLGNIAKGLITTQLKKRVNQLIPQTYQSNRPEYQVFYSGQSTGPVVFDPQPLDQRGTVRTSTQSTVKAQIQSAARKATSKLLNNLVAAKLPKALQPIAKSIIPQQTEPEKIATFAQAAENFRNKALEDQRLKGRLKSANRLQSAYFSEPFPSQTSTLSNFKDKYNIPKEFIPEERKREDSVYYNNIITDKQKINQKTDIIKFIFSDASGTNNKPVQFRALLSNIKESIKPNFNEQQYIGRTERFITYGGVKRTISIEFNVVAFSQAEIRGVWTRVNYLTGLAFPKSSSPAGFMVPPLFKLTVGGLFDNQPCYIETLDYDFLDDTITYDIDKEVPFAIKVNMQLSVLEKRTKFFDSPFYKITEDLAKVQDQLRPRGEQVANFARKLTREERDAISLRNAAGSIGNQANRAAANFRNSIPSFDSITQRGATIDFGRTSPDQFNSVEPVSIPTNRSVQEFGEDADTTSALLNIPNI
jgi:hypothetical protein